MKPTKNILITMLYHARQKNVSARAIGLAEILPKKYGLDETAAYCRELGLQVVAGRIVMKDRR